MIFKWSFIFLCSVFITTNARPELPSPYNNYLPPSAITQNNNLWSQNLQQQQQINIPINSYGTPILRTSSSQILNGAISAPNRNYGSPDLIYSNQSPAAAITNYPSQNPVNFQKHIYVHVAPPDVEEDRIQKLQQQAASTQKHYKIIFIKTPSYPTQAQYYAQQQQQALQQEKTLIYVLVKKPDDALEVRANQIAQQTSINKPEVYFIKYKAKADQINGGQQQKLAENTVNNSVVVDNALIGNQNQGYQYNKPGGILK